MVKYAKAKDSALDGSGYNSLTKLMNDVKAMMDTVKVADPHNFAAEVHELAKRSGITVDEDDKKDIITFMESNFNLQKIPILEKQEIDNAVKEVKVGTKTLATDVVEGYWPTPV